MKSHLQNQHTQQPNSSNIQQQNVSTNHQELKQMKATLFKQCLKKPKNKILGKYIKTSLIKFAIHHNQAQQFSKPVDIFDYINEQGKAVMQYLRHFITKDNLKEQIRKVQENEKEYRRIIRLKKKQVSNQKVKGQIEAVQDINEDINEKHRYTISSNEYSAQRNDEQINQNLNQTDIMHSPYTNDINVQNELDQSYQQGQEYQCEWDQHPNVEEIFTKLNIQVIQTTKQHRKISCKLYKKYKLLVQQIQKRQRYQHIQLQTHQNNSLTKQNNPNPIQQTTEQQLHDNQHNNQQKIHKYLISQNLSVNQQAQLSSHYQLSWLHRIYPQEQSSQQPEYNQFYPITQDLSFAMPKKTNHSYKYPSQALSQKQSKQKQYSHVVPSALKDNTKQQKNHLLKHHDQYTKLSTIQENKLEDGKTISDKKIESQQESQLESFQDKKSQEVSLFNQQMIQKSDKFTNKKSKVYEKKKPIHLDSEEQTFFNENEISCSNISFASVDDIMDRVLAKRKLKKATGYANRCPSKKESQL